MPQFACLSFLPILITVQANAPTHRELSEQYTYSVELDTNGRINYTMFYDYDKDLSILQIALLVQTTGWIGLGFSPNGRLPGSDIMVGWVDEDGTIFLQDRYTFSPTTPSYDASQDLKLIEANEEGEFTTIQFERKFDTCDPDDRVISFGDTTYLIYAYHTEDPINNVNILRPNFRGSTAINLFGQPESVPPLPLNLQSFDVTNSNVSIPAKDSIHLCTIMEIPQVIQNNTHYILQFSEKITPESTQHVRCILIHICDSFDLTGDPDVGVTQECDVISKNVQPCMISNVIAEWAVGGNGHTFPEGVAIPIGGEKDLHAHLLLEMHYDNPEKLSGIIDSSGIRFYYTDQPPEENVGILTFGHSVVGHMIIPPLVERYTVKAYCSERCLDAFFPEEGITVYASSLHTHKAGVQLVVRHIRDGVELDPIDINNNYKFDFQQTNYVPLVKILPGDEMILECVYDSSMRNITTFGGEGIKDEICLVYLYYYPASNLSTCLSYAYPPAYDEWLKAYVPSNKQFIIDAAAANNISAVRSIFDSLDWSEESYRMFEKVGQTGEQVHLCFSSTNKNNGFMEVDQPITVESPLKQTENCPNKVDISGSATLHSSITTVVLYWMAAAIMHIAIVN